MPHAAEPPPTVSLIMPIYNVEEFVQHAISSIVSSFAAWRDTTEVIIVNDASTDNSAQVARSALVQSGLAHKIIELAENGGVGVARREGVASAGGDYIWFIDPDDELVPQAAEVVFRKLQKQVSRDEILEFPVISWICESGEVIKRGHFNDARSPLNSTNPVRMSAETYVARLLLRREPGVLWTKVFPKEMLIAEKVDINRQSEDILTVLNVLSSGGAVLQYADPLYRYRERATSLSRQDGYNLGSIERYRECRAKVRGARWWDARAAVPLDYFSLSRIWVPELRSHARVHDIKRYGQAWAHLSRDISMGRLFRVAVSRRLPLGRMKWIVRVMLLPRAFPALRAPFAKLFRL